jgi:hypothetical protein
MTKLIFFFTGLGFELRKQALYHLSHTSSTFYSGYFRDRGLELFAWASLMLSLSLSLSLFSSMKKL